MPQPALSRFLNRVLLAMALSVALAAPTLAAEPDRSGTAERDSAAKAASTAPVRVTEVEGVTEYRLHNGLRVLLIPDQSTDTLTVNITYLVGSRHEGNGETGMAHLLEHLLFRGTPRHPEIKAEFQKRGSRFNGTTSNDRTNYFQTLPASRENLDWAISLEADRMLHANVSRKDLDAEMTVVRNEFESGENSPANVLRERITSAAYLWHGYGRAVIGARSDIENVPIDKLQAFYRQYYQPDNAVLTVAGRFVPAEALQAVQQHFGPLPRPGRVLPRTYTIEPTQDGERSVVLRRVGDVQMVGALYHLPPGPHPEYAAVDVLVSVLSHVPTGRLHRALVQQGKAASAFGFERQLHDAGYAYFVASLRQDQSVDAAREAMQATVEGLKANPVTDEEVERARTRLLNEVEMVVANSRSLALTLSETIAMGDWRLLFLHRDRLRKVTTADVQAAALRYLKPSNRTTGTFLPTPEPDRADIPAVPDIAGMLAGYQTVSRLSEGESFDASPANIEARTIRRQIPGGLKLLLLPRKTRGSTVVAQLSLRWGNESSKTGRATACSMASAMLMRGTTTRTREDIANEFNRLRANVGLGTEGGSLDTVRENLPDTLRLVAEILRRPSFPEDEYQQLRQASLASLESQRSDPAALAGIELVRHLNPYPSDHWYYNATLEERIARLQALRLEDVRRCYMDFVGASHGELAVVGDFDPDEITRLATELFGNWSSPADFARIPVRLTPVPPISRLIETPDKANATLRAGMTIPIKDDDADYPALVLANYLIGGTSGARLPNRIREQEGLSYSVSSFFGASSFESRAEFGVAAIFAPQNRTRVETLIHEELQRVADEGFTDAEVELGRKGLLQARQVARNQDGAVAGRLATLSYIGRDFLWDRDQDEKIAALTAQDLNAALRRHLDFRKLSMVWGGDFRAVAR